MLHGVKSLEAILRTMYVIVWKKESLKYPPPGQSVCKAGITGPYFTLHPLSGGTTYYIWVRAESSGGQGPYSRRKKETTYNGTVFVAVYQYFTHVKCTVKLFECAGYHRAFSEVNCFRPLGESN